MRPDIALVQQEAYLLLVAISPNAAQWLASNYPTSPRIGRALVVQPQAIQPIVRDLMDSTDFNLLAI